MSGAVFGRAAAVLLPARSSFEGCAHPEKRLEHSWPTRRVTRALLIDGDAVERVLHARVAVAKGELMYGVAEIKVLGRERDQVMHVHVALPEQHNSSAPDEPRKCEAVSDRIQTCA